MSALVAGRFFVGLAAKGPPSTVKSIGLLASRLRVVKPLTARAHALPDEPKAMLKRSLILLALTLSAWAGPLHDSAHAGNLSKVKDFIEVQKVPVDQKGYYGETALGEAASDGQLEVAKYLLSKGANVNARNESGETPLFQASIQGHLDVITALLDAGADPNATEPHSYTPLSSVAEIGSLAEDRRAEVMRLLVSRGADLKLRMRDATVLHLLARGSHLDAMGAVIELGLPVDVRTSAGLTPLHSAVQGDEYRSIPYLVSKGADVNAGSNDGTTPLMKAAGLGYPKSVSELLKCKARLDLKNKAGKTALDIARSKNNSEIVKLLSP